jgi:hypothetical protein
VFKELCYLLPKASFGRVGKDAVAGSLNGALEFAAVVVLQQLHHMPLHLYVHAQQGVTLQVCFKDLVRLAIELVEEVALDLLYITPGSLHIEAIFL